MCNLCPDREPDPNWKECKQFNWCFQCWFNAKIESKTNELGIAYLCLHCGVIVQDYYPDEPNMERPRFFTVEEWGAYWKEHFKGELPIG